MSRPTHQDPELRALVVRSDVTRDVAYFYHQQAEYDFVCDDLDHGRLDPPCWEYLALDDRDDLVERGCLAMVFAAASHEAGNVGIVLGERLGACRDAVAAYSTQSPEMARLRQSALAALDLAAIPSERRDFEQVDALALEAEWIHVVTVRRYFETIVERMKRNLGGPGQNPVST